MKIDFLEIFYNKHQQIKHLFFIENNNKLYAHIFSLKFNKTSNYLEKISIIGNLLRYLKFDVLYLTNSFITNVPSFNNCIQLDIDKILDSIKYHYSLIVIPSFLYDILKVNDTSYIKVEVEEEMVINIKPHWKAFDDYIKNLKRKYKNKVTRILDNTKDLEIRELDKSDLVYHSNNINNLFHQVVKTSKFKGPEFNTTSFELLVSKSFFKVYGFFLSERLVGFSSEIYQGNSIYSYYVGYDKKLNGSLPIYSRMLIESISNSIKLNKEILVLGRTANEFKSNFGATPIRSYVYIKARNKYLHAIIKPLLSRLRIKSWIQRNPFKMDDK